MLLYHASMFQYCWFRETRVRPFYAPESIIMPRNVPDRKPSLPDLKIIFSRDTKVYRSEAGSSLDRVGRLATIDYG